MEDKQISKYTDLDCSREAILAEDFIEAMTSSAYPVKQVEKKKEKRTFKINVNDSRQVKRRKKREQAKRNIL